MRTSLALHPVACFGDICLPICISSLQLLTETYFHSFIASERPRSSTQDRSCQFKFMIGLPLLCLLSIRFMSAFPLNFTFTFIPRFFLIFITLFCILGKLKIIVHINVSIFHNISSVLYCSWHYTELVTGIHPSPTLFSFNTVFSHS